MKRYSLLVALLGSFGVCSASYAQTNDKTSFPSVPWTSKSSSVPVTVQNGTGAPLLIEITVSPDNSGINVKNCGNTTHIDAGSSGICATNDPANPVSFSSDTASGQASGTYQIKQQ